MQTIHFRPYRDESDITKIQEAHARWIYKADDCGRIHTGDIPHRIFNGMRGRYPLKDFIGLWEDTAGTLLAWVVAYPRWAVFDCAVAPQLIGTESERDIYQWAEDTTLAWWKRVPGNNTDLIMDVFHLDNHRKKIAHAMGYEDGGHVYTYTERKLNDNIPESVLPDGYRFPAGDPAGFTAIVPGS